ncbi:O-antigen polymerase [Sphingomonas sp. LH128]|nr:O-antigen polymerase [Sphingomonas sp. LH128]
MAVVFGGGGSGAGIANLVVQLAALGALAYHRDAFAEFFNEAPRALSVVVGVTVALPLMQCIPLPPAVWHLLPGRIVVEQSIVLIGEQDNWMPISLNLNRTIIAFLALVPPLAILILTWRCTFRDSWSLLAVLVTCCVFCIVLGAQQLALGNRELMLYSEGANSQGLRGTFANRNTAGLFIDIGLCALVGLLWRPRQSVLRMGVGFGVALLLGLGLVLTQSRSSMTLVVVPVVMFLFYLWTVRVTFLEHRARLLALIVTVAVIFGAVAMLGSNARVQRSLSRFDTLEDARPAIWQDAQSSISRFWPVGSGIGTFDEVFQLDESLENLSPGRAARAHNEYLETMVESGAIAPFLIVLWAVTIVVLAWRGIRREVGRGSQAAALAIFILLAFQSILDYPLRSQALLCVAAMALGIFMARSAHESLVARELR